MSPRPAPPLRSAQKGGTRAAQRVLLRIDILDPDDVNQHETVADTRGSFMLTSTRSLGSSDARMSVMPGHQACLLRLVAALMLQHGVSGCLDSHSDATGARNASSADAAASGPRETAGMDAATSARDATGTPDATGIHDATGTLAPEIASDAALAADAALAVDAAVVEFVPWMPYARYCGPDCDCSLEADPAAWPAERGVSARGDFFQPHEPKLTTANVGKLRVAHTFASALRAPVLAVDHRVLVQFESSPPSPVPGLPLLEHLFVLAPVPDAPTCVARLGKTAPRVVSGTTVFEHGSAFEVTADAPRYSRSVTNSSALHSVVLGEELIELVASWSTPPDDLDAGSTDASVDPSGESRVGLYATNLSTGSERMVFELTPPLCAVVTGLAADAASNVIVVSLVGCAPEPPSTVAPPGRLLGIDAASGVLLYEKQLVGLPLPTDHSHAPGIGPTIFDAEIDGKQRTLVGIVDGDHDFIAFHVRSGTTAWLAPPRTTTAQLRSGNRAGANGESVFLSVHDCSIASDPCPFESVVTTLVVLDPSTGAQRTATALGELATSPISSTATLAFVAGKRLFALDPTTGKLLTQRRLSDYNPSSAIAISGGRLHILYSGTLSTLALPGDL